LDGTVLAPALYQRRSLAAMLLAKTRVIIDRQEKN